jgi:hypothetical protein
MKTILNAFRREALTPTVMNEPSPDIPRMELRERIEVRRRAMLDCARQVLSEWGFTSGAYRLKASPTDDRGHHYDLLVDIPSDLVTQTGNQWLAPVVTALTQQAKDELGLALVGVYWRPCAELSFFEVTMHDLPDPEPKTPPPNLANQPLVISGKQYATDLAPLADQ